MLHNKIEKGAMVDTELWDIIDEVANNRPNPIRAYDQIYMYSSDMFLQTKLLLDYSEKKSIAFLGDGDGINSLLALFSKREGIPISETIVLDFDERILNSYKQLYSSHNITNAHLDLYNVLEPLPEKYHAKYDLFYINPPYGSKNNGLSCIAWLHRCMDLCTSLGSGFVVVPYDKKQPWTISAMSNIQKFLIEHGFVIRDMISEFHKYHLEDNPDLRSATIIVDRVNNQLSEYHDKLLPKSFAQNLYGSPRRLPRYIMDDRTQYGYPDFHWIYGQDYTRNL